MLSPLLYTLYTYDCVSSPSDNITIKFADDTTLIGLISDSNETAYREEVQRLVEWCSKKNLVIDTSKTKELIVDFRRRTSNLQSICIDGQCVERVSNFKFLGVYTDAELQWGFNTSEVVKKAQQHLLRILKRLNLEKKLLTVFYRCSVERVLTYCISVWFSSCTTAHKKAIQTVINTAQKITGHYLPSLEDLYSIRCLRRAYTIIKDSTHPGHRMFELLPLGKCYRQLKTKTNRLRDSFYNRAISLLNKNKIVHL